MFTATLASRKTALMSNACDQHKHNVNRQKCLPNWKNVHFETDTKITFNSFHAQSQIEKCTKFAFRVDFQSESVAIES